MKNSKTKAAVLMVVGFVLFVGSPLLAHVFTIPIKAADQHYSAHYTSVPYPGIMPGEAGPEIVDTMTTNQTVERSVLPQSENSMKAATIKASTTLQSSSQEELLRFDDASKIALASGYPLPETTNTSHITIGAAGLDEKIEQNSTGLQYFFPEMTNQQSYNYFEPTTDTTSSINFLDPVTLNSAMPNSVKTFAFEHTVEPQRVDDPDGDSTFLGVDIPQGMNAYSAVYRHVNVEPQSGLIVAQKSWTWVFLAPNDQEAQSRFDQFTSAKSRLPQIEGTVVYFENNWNAHTKDEQLSQAQKYRHTYWQFGVLLPTLIGLGGVLLIAIGAVLYRRTKNRGESTSES